MCDVVAVVSEFDTMTIRMEGRRFVGYTKLCRGNEMRRNLYDMRHRVKQVDSTSARYQECICCQSDREEGKATCTIPHAIVQEEGASSVRGLNGKQQSKWVYRI